MYHLSSYTTLENYPQLRIKVHRPHFKIRS